VNNAVGFSTLNQAIGFNAAQIDLSTNITGNIVLGNLDYLTAGSLGQNDDTIAIGVGAGNYMQGMDAIAIGTGAGYSGQGANAVAIGNIAGQYNQLANTIAINASGTALDTSSNLLGKLGQTVSKGTALTGGLWAAPIKTQTSTAALFTGGGTLIPNPSPLGATNIAIQSINPLASLYYDPITCEISYYTPQWYNVLANRLSGNTYTNNTGRPITVSICYTWDIISSGDAGGIDVVVGGISIISQFFYSSYVAAGYFDTVNFIVPPNQTYTATLNTILVTPTISLWSELR